MIRTDPFTENSGDCRGFPTVSPLKLMISMLTPQRRKQPAYQNFRVQSIDDHVICDFEPALVAGYSSSKRFRARYAASIWVPSIILSWV